MKKEEISRELIIESIVQAIPYIGGSLANLYFGHKQEKRFKRLERFYQELQEEIERIGPTIPDFSLQNPEELSAILEELNEKVEIEHLEVKRKYYKEYFKNSMLFPINKNFDERKLFLDILSALTPLQIEIVIFLSSQTSSVLGSSITKPGVDQSLITGALAQLKTFGIIDSILANIFLAGSSSAINENISLSPFGKKFHIFCLNS